MQKETATIAQYLGLVTAGRMAGENLLTSDFHITESCLNVGGVSFDYMVIRLVAESGQFRIYATTIKRQRRPAGKRKPLALTAGIESQKSGTIYSAELREEIPISFAEITFYRESPKDEPRAIHGLFTLINDH